MVIAANVFYPPDRTSGWSEERTDARRVRKERGATVKRIFGFALLFVGVFLIVLAPLVKWVVAPRVIKAPLEIPEKYTKILAHGDKFNYLDASQGTIVPISVSVTRTIIGDVSKDQGGDSKNAVYDESLCLTRDDGSHPGCVDKTDARLITNTTDRVAFDRKTGMAVNDPKYRTNVNGDPNIKHEGLSYKFPIDTEKKSYPFFDTVVGKAFPMNYAGTEKIEGMKVYKFVQKIVDQPVYTNGVLPSSYTNTRTVWIEPTTGVIVKGQEELTQMLTGRASLDPNSELRDPSLANVIALQGTLVFTDPTVRNQKQLANDNLPKIDLVRTWIPLIAGIVGLLALAGGLVLLLTGRRQPPPAEEIPPWPQPEQPVPPGYAAPPGYAPPQRGAPDTEPTQPLPHPSSQR
jgi:hypothetical protein